MGIEQYIQYEKYSLVVVEDQRWIEHVIDEYPFTDYYVALTIARHYDANVDDVIYSYTQQGVRHYTMNYRDALNVSKFYQVECMTIVAMFEIFAKQCDAAHGSYNTLFDMIDNALKMFDVDVKKRFIQSYYHRLKFDTDPSSYFAMFTSRYKTVVNVRANDDMLTRVANKRSKFNRKHAEMRLRQDTHYSAFVRYHSVLHMFDELERQVTPSHVVSFTLPDEYKSPMQLILESIRTDASIDSALIKIHVDETTISCDRQYNLPNVFASIECSPDIPYAEVVCKSNSTGIHWIKMYTGDMFPTRSLLTSPLTDTSSDHIILLYKTCRDTKTSIMSRTVYDGNINKYFDNQSTVKYTDVTFDVHKRLAYFKYDYKYNKPYAQISADVCSMLRLETRGTSHDEHAYIVETSNYVCTRIVPNLYVYPTLLEHLVRTCDMFEPIRQYMFMDERRKSILHGSSTCIVIRIGLSVVTASFSSHTCTNRMKRLNNTKIYEGWNYTKIVMRNIENHYMFKFVDKLLQQLLMEYIRSKEYLECLYDIRSDYQGVPDDYLPVPDIIRDYKKEVPELWVPNTSKQVDASCLRIVSDRLADKIREVTAANLKPEDEMCVYKDDPLYQTMLTLGGRRVLRYPPERTDPCSRNYVAADVRRPYIGLIRNTKANNNVYKLLPNCYTTDHATKHMKHMYKYIQDPIYHRNPDQQANVNDVYKSDTVPRTRAGYAQLPVVVRTTITGTLSPTPYTLYRESLGSDSDNFIECLYYALHNGEHISAYATSLRATLRSEVEQRVHVCSQDMPYMSLSDMMQLYDNGTNLCYFYRAFEEYLHVNIMIFMDSGKSLSIYPSNFCDNYMWKLDMSRPLIVMMCFVSSHRRCQYELIVKLRGKEKSYMFNPRTHREDKLNCLSMALYKHAFLSHVDTRVAIDVPNVLVKDDGKTLDELIAELRATVDNHPHARLVSVPKVGAGTLTGQHLSSDGKAVAVRYKVDTLQVWVSCLSYPLMVDTCDIDVRHTVDSVKHLCHAPTKLLVTIDPFDMDTKYVDGIVDADDIVYYTKRQLLTDTEAEYIVSIKGVTHTTTSTLSVLHNMKSLVHIKHDVIVILLKHCTADRYKMIESCVKYTRDQHAVDSGWYMCNNELVTEFSSWDSCYDYYNQSGIMYNGMIELQPSDEDSVASLVAKLNSNEDVRLITPTAFLYARVTNCPSVVAFDSLESFMGWRRVRYNNVVVSDKLQYLKEDYILQVSVRFERVLLCVKASYVCGKSECIRVITKWNQAIFGIIIDDSHADLRRVKTVSGLVSLLLTVAAPIADNFHDIYVAYSRRDNYYVPLLLMPVNVGSM